MATSAARDASVQERSGWRWMSEIALYELTGPRLMTFAEAVARDRQGDRSEHRVRAAPHGAETALAEYHVPADFLWLIDYLFSEVLDGRNSRLADGVERALGRKPRDFSEYARAAAAAGVWERARPSSGELAHSARFSLLRS
jgi:hypothetical protein